MTQTHIYIYIHTYIYIYIHIYIYTYVHVNICILSPPLWTERLKSLMQKNRIKNHLSLAKLAISCPLHSGKNIRIVGGEYPLGQISAELEISRIIHSLRQDISFRDLEFRLLFAVWGLYRGKLFVLSFSMAMKQLTPRWWSMKSCLRVGDRWRSPDLGKPRNTNSSNMTSFRVLFGKKAWHPRQETIIVGDF